jgi:hypothetical protein
VDTRTHAHRTPPLHSLTRDVPPPSAPPLPDAAARERLCDSLLANAEAAAVEAPALVAAAALALHAAAGAPVLRDALCGADARAGDALRVLRALRAAFEACDAGDGALRGCVAVRLGLLLEEQGELGEARAAAQQVGHSRRLGGLGGSGQGRPISIKARASHRQQVVGCPIQARRACRRTQRRRP